jgi:hypothetical protein
MKEIETPDAVTEAVVEAVSESLDDVVADVIESQEQSAELAEQIAEAALEGERGRRIETLERDLAACLSLITTLTETLETLPTMLAETTLTQLEPIVERLSAVEDALDAMTLAALSSSIQQPLEEPEPGQTEEPMQAEPPADAVENPAQVPRARLALSTAQITAYRFTEIPEVVLSQEQNANLAQALQRVLRHYPVVVSEKQADIIGLVVAAGSIAFTQVTLYKQRINQTGHAAR